MLSCFSIWLFVAPWTVTRQASLSMGFPRQEYWSELPCPSPGDLPNSGIEPMFLTISCIGKWVLCHWYHLGSQEAKKGICRLTSTSWLWLGLWPTQNCKWGSSNMVKACRLSMRYTTFLIPVKVKHPWLAEEQRNRAEARTTARSILTQSWSLVFKWLQMPSDHVVFKATNMGKPWHQTDTNAHFFSVSLGHLTLKKNVYVYEYPLNQHSVVCKWT